MTRQSWHLWLGETGAGLLGRPSWARPVERAWKEPFLPLTTGLPAPLRLDRNDLAGRGVQPDLSAFRWDLVGADLDRPGAGPGGGGSGGSFAAALACRLGGGLRLIRNSSGPGCAAALIADRRRTAGTAARDLDGGERWAERSGDAEAVVQSRAATPVVADLLGRPARPAPRRITGARPLARRRSAGQIEAGGI